MPGLSQIFAQNLRKLLRGEQSIAHVCRVLDINRQQFNRYLAGEVLPSAKNLRKLSGYFKVSESNILSQNFEFDITPAGPQPDGFLSSLNSLFTANKEFIEDGHYYWYFALSGQAGLCMKSILHIKTRGSKLEFSALLIVRNSTDPSKIDIWYRVSGLVREQDGRALFLGNVRGDPADIAVLIVEPVRSLRKKMFAGIATSFRTAEIAGRRIALHYLGAGQSALRLARHCGMLKVDDPSIEPAIRRAISADDGPHHPVLTAKTQIAIIGR